MSSVINPAVLACFFASLPLVAACAQRADLPERSDSIIELTEDGARGNQRLGDLHLKPMGQVDIGLRFWGGYGLVGSLTRQIGWAWARVDSVVLERTVCFGSCPAYRLSVVRSGVVNFQSRNRHDKSAAVIDTGPPQVLDSIVTRAEAIGFNSYPNDISRDRTLCPVPFTDHPTITIALFGDQKKQVVYYTGCYVSANKPAPAAALVKLSELANAIDSLTGSSRWARPGPVR